MLCLETTIRRPTRARPAANHRAGRRGISFCYAMVVFTAMMCLGGIFMQVGTNALSSSYSRLKHQQALFLAESAAERAFWMMKASASGIDNLNATLAITQAEVDEGITKSYTSPMWEVADGHYQFAAVAPHDGVAGTVKIEAVGISRDGAREDIAVIVRQDAVQSGSFLGAECFSYALFADHNLTIDGGAIIDGNPTWGGAGIYANGHVLINDPGSWVTGDISATGTIDGNFGQSYGGQQAYCAREVMPDIDLAHYDALANERYGTGGTVNMTAGADGSAGTYADPWIIFVNGKANLAGPLIGVGVIVATDGFQITGDVYYGAPDSSWALVTTGTFEITGSQEIHGLIYCHDTDDEAAFVANGYPQVFGSVVADVITLKSDFDVEWDDAPSQIEKLPGSAVAGGPPVVDTLYWERV